jgi:hypothetical protein
MFRVILIIFFILFHGVNAFAFPPTPPVGKNPSFDSVGVGSSISATSTEYTVWEILDSNGDVVASQTVECSNITDGSQVCQIHFWVMSDTAGTLTKEFTIDTDTD